MWSNNYIFRCYELMLYRNLCYRYVNRITNDSIQRLLLLEKLDRYALNYSPTSVLDYIKAFFEDNDLKIERFIDYILKSLIFTLIGKRRGGKTALMLWIAEVMHNLGYNIFAYNISGEDLPDWVTILKFDKDEPYKGVSNKSLTLHDEMHFDIDKNAFNSKENNAVRDWISTTGHRKQSVIYGDQLLSNIPIDLIRYSDVKLIKPFALTQMATDRQELFEHLSLFIPIKREDVLVQTDKEVIPFSNPLPTFWTEDISTSHK